MKKENKEGPAVLKGLPIPKQVSPKEIENLAGQKNSVVIDGRDWQEFRQGHIKGALFAPLDKYFIMVTGSYIEPGTEIALITDEDLVVQTVTALSRIGHDRITSYITTEQFAGFDNKKKALDSIEEISVSELKDVQSRGEGHILDVRNASELAETGQIEGAQNVAFTRLLLQQDEIPKDSKIYVYCRSGNRSEYACSFLKNSGFEVSHVAGGIIAWQGSGGEVVPAMQSQFEK
jgi:hydroxyacylglutathione hydrolase